MADNPAKPRFSWQINRRLAAATLMMLPILICLGWWQLTRADEKRQLLAELERAMAAEPLSALEYRGHESAQLRFRPVRLAGQFDPARYWLVENKVHQGRLGYSVIAPFTAVTGQHFLVGRGWLPAGVTREELPAVAVPAGETVIEGVLDRPSVHPLLEFNGAGPWPQRILTLDLDRQGEALGYELEPWVVHLVTPGEAGFTPIWAPVVVPVAKHLGYAAQWFTMAAALALVSLFANSNLARVLFHRSPA